MAKSAKTTELSIDKIEAARDAQPRVAMDNIRNGSHA